MAEPLTIVLAHGRAADLDIASTTSRLWEDAVRQGLRRIGSEYADSVEIRYAFFGGLWRRDAARAMPQFSDAGGRAYTVTLTPEPRVVPVEDGIVERGLGALGHFGASLLPDKALEALLARAIPDVFDYLDDAAWRRPTNAIVEKACRDAKAAVLVGFSMASIVGYDVLRNADPAFPVRAFVTCGSPIGLDPIHRRLRTSAGTPFPPNLDLWLNVWNEDDVATGVHGEELSRLFPGGTIQSAETVARTPSATNIFAAHNAIDYLSSLAMALAVHVSLATVAQR